MSRRSQAIIYVSIMNQYVNRVINENYAMPVTCIALTQIGDTFSV